jgi:HEAT repeat protein
VVISHWSLLLGHSVLLVALDGAVQRQSYASAPASAVSELDDILTQDIIHFRKLLGSPVPERRIEGVQGLSQLKDWQAEPELVRLLEEPSPPVRREAVLALGRVGTASSVPHLITLLDNPSWELRQNVWPGLCRITAQHFPANQKDSWTQWWQSNSTAGIERTLLATLNESVAAMPVGLSRRDALRALPHLATPSAEDTLLGCLRTAQLPPLDAGERALLVETLERIGTAKSVPVLARQRSDPAAWALERIGGPEAEKALLDARSAAGVDPELHLSDRVHHQAILSPGMGRRLARVFRRG